MKTSPLFAAPAIRVEQPIGTFWAASVPAEVLLEATAPDPLRVLSDPKKGPLHEWDGGRGLAGTQRNPEEPRLKQIGQFITTLEATFPNSIILAVDSDSDEGEPESWRIDAKPGSAVGQISIPKNGKLARVVDGQHRLYGFKFAGEGRQPFDLLCAVFFDLPEPMQAYVFATINTNQKPVKRGLALNLYGYNVEDQERSEWSPEKLAVFFARRLNFEKDSPLHLRVKIEAQSAPVPRLLPGASRAISTAAVVDVVLGLISRNHRRDRDALKQRSVFRGATKRKELLRTDSAPLREWYLDEADAELYGLLKSFFRVVDDLLWEVEPAKLTRAVDIRALGDFLGDLMLRFRKDGPSNATQNALKEAKRVLKLASEVDFEDPFFEASYRGRRRIQLTLRRLAGQPFGQDVSAEDAAHYERILRKD